MSSAGSNIEVAIQPPIQLGGDLSSLSLSTEYRSIKDDPIKNFYRPCLMNASTYKRASGYFRSSVFAVIGASLVEFSRRGGITCLICSPELSQEDIDCIALGYASRDKRIATLLIQDIDSLLAIEDSAYPVRVLATLISVGSLDIKLAVRSDRKGLYHEKIGIFSDRQGNRVSFKGSANETWSGWHSFGNFESIEVFCDWRGGLEQHRVASHERHFDALWSEQDPDVEVFHFPTDALDHLKRHSLGELRNVEIDEFSIAPKRRSALPHQENAIQAWEKNACRGIFEHATGSGKTFTAIIAIQKQAAAGLPTLVVVPSQLLLDQWAKELRDEVPDAALLLAGAGNVGWRNPNRLKSMSDSNHELGARIILSTMQTASSADFLSDINDGEHLLLIADEVHQVGSPQNAKVLSLNPGKRLGLSATPARYGDPLGTLKIMDFFGGVLPPSITLQDAVKAGRLVNYEYHPHPINLTAPEAAEWREVSRSIQLENFKSKADESGRRPLSERAKLLLIKRSRIAKKAHAKIGYAVDVIKNHYESGQSWLVYCEDSDQLGEVINQLKTAGFDSVEYHSSMLGDKNATMSWFRSYGGILVSIRCLDEGVDIPAVTHALILASSQNPRQFIQRRGRVLRKSPGKQIAVVYDAVVVPISAEDDPEQMSLLRSELVRSIEFADHAINRSAGAELRAIASAMGIDPSSLLNEEVEDE